MYDARKARLAEERRRTTEVSSTSRLFSFFDAAGWVHVLLLCWCACAVVLVDADDWGKERNLSPCTREVEWDVNGICSCHIADREIVERRELMAARLIFGIKIVMNNVYYYE